MQYGTQMTQMEMMNADEIKAHGAGRPERLYIDIGELPEDLQKQVKEFLQARAKDPEQPLTYKEAALCYNYQYNTLRIYVHQGLLVPVQTEFGPRLKHSEMQRFKATRNPLITGRPRRNGLMG